MTFNRKALTDEYFISSDPRALQETLRASLSARLGYTIDDADPAFLIACSILPPICQCLAKSDLSIKQRLTQFATDEALEAMAEHLGLSRFETSAASFAQDVLISSDNIANVAYPLTYSVTLTLANPYTGDSWTMDADGEWASSDAVDTADESAEFAASFEMEDDGFIPPYCTHTCVLNSLTDADGVDWSASASFASGLSTLPSDGFAILSTGSDDETDDQLAERCHYTRTSLLYVGSLMWYRTMLQNAGYPVADVAYLGIVDSAAKLSILLYGDNYDDNALRTTIQDYLLANLLMPGDNFTFVNPERFENSDGEAATMSVTIYINTGDLTTQNAATTAFNTWIATRLHAFGMPDVADLCSYIKNAVPAVDYVQVSHDAVETSVPNAGMAADQFSLSFATKWWK